MSKSKPSKKTSSHQSPEAAVAALRGQIDRLDKELVGLMNDRAKLALRIGKVKNSAGQIVYSPAREEEVMQRVLSASKGPLPDTCVRAVFRELISGSRSLEKKLRVAYLGPMYSYSYLAALHRFGESVELTPVGGIPAVFEEVERGQSDYGLVPLENSTDGRVVDTLDMFTRSPVRICAEVQLRIHHHLLGKGLRADVIEVYSKPQAISQCRNWLAKHVPQARLIEVDSTSFAAQIARDKPGAAAIAGLQAGIHNGLDVLAEKIEDNPGNITRFSVIGMQSGPKTGNDKTAVMFEVEHRPGALADGMLVFKKCRLNLTWIESFPIPDSPGRYLFFVEIEGHEGDRNVRRALEILRRKSLRLAVLGSFARCQPIE